MWKWLEAIAGYGRLEQENNGLREEITLLRAQLFAEIDSNREREDELVRLTVRPLDQDGVVGRRRNVLAPPPLSNEEPETPQQTIPHLSFHSKPDPDMVQLRARDFMAEAARSGVYYDYDELCKRIAENPEEYLSN